MDAERDRARAPSLQVVCYPGHGILVHAGRVVLSSGDPTVIEEMVLVVRANRMARSCTVTMTEGLVACLEASGDHVLVVGVPSEINATVIHDKMRRALALFARSVTPPPWTPGGGGHGGSGAPAEVFASVPRARRN